MNRPVVAFFGYARAADEGTDGAIGALHAALEGRVRVLAGSRGFTLWRDTLAIRWGEDWEQRLNGAIEEALFYVPVLTPDFFESEWCRREAAAFLARLDAGDARTRVLPLYVLEDLRFEREAMRKRDPLRTRLWAVQLHDLRAHLDGGWDTAPAKAAIHGLAKAIADRVVELEHEEELRTEARERLAASDFAGAAEALRAAGLSEEAEATAWSAPSVGLEHGVVYRTRGLCVFLFGAEAYAWREDGSLAVEMPGITTGWWRFWTQGQYNTVATDGMRLPGVGTFLRRPWEGARPVRELEGPAEREARHERGGRTRVEVRREGVRILLVNGGVVTLAVGGAGVRYKMAAGGTAEFP